MNILFDPYYQGMLVRAFGMTVLISVIVIAASNILALPLAIYMQRPKARLRGVIIGYSFFARAAPVLALLFALYYGLPRPWDLSRPAAIGPDRADLFPRPPIISNFCDRGMRASRRGNLMPRGRWGSGRWRRRSRC